MYALFNQLLIHIKQTDGNIAPYDEEYSSDLDVKKLAYNQAVKKI